MSDIYSAISNFGFPIVVSVFLLWGLIPIVNKFGEKIDRFSEVLEGKPSEGRKGLITVIQENSGKTNDLTIAVNKLTKTQ